MKTFSLFIILAMTVLNVISQTTTIKVWPDKVPGSKSDPAYKEETIYDNGRPRVSKVTDPEMIVYLSEKGKATGAAVVICPGGGYGRLAIDHEGHDVAKWLNSYGIAAFVLKYRLPSDVIMMDKTIGPLQDGQEAIRIVRRRAAEWNINPSKIGILGFSAGGHFVATVSTHYADSVYQVSDNTSARPDFSILVYPVISLKEEITHGGTRQNLLGLNPPYKLVEKFSNETRVNAQTPPAFLVHSADDKTVPVQNSMLYFQALLKYSIPSELHVYESGGHGYGLAPKGASESGWPDACIKWLRKRSII